MKINLLTERISMVRRSKLLIVTCFLGCLFFKWSLSARLLKKTLNISVIEEVISNKTFTHRVDILNGKCDERWAIDGHPIGEDEYDEAILQAEKEERRAERMAAKDEQRKHDEFVLATQRAGWAKLLDLYLLKIQQELNRLNDSRLEPFFFFEADTISSEKEFEYIKNVLVVRAKEMLDQVGEADLEEIRGMASQVQDYPKRIRALYYATVKNAQAHSDDTKLLKDLLSIVSDL
jgi:hypothetical protein